MPRRAERGVVHRRRHRMRHRRADEAVDARSRRSIERKRYVVEQRVAASAGRLPLERAGVGPARSEAAGSTRVDEAVLAHADQRPAPLARRSARRDRAAAGSRSGASVVTATLTTSAPVARIACDARRRDRPARRRNRASTARCAGRRCRRCRSSKPRAPLEVDVLGAERERLARGCRWRSSSDPCEVPAFPRRPAGDDHRPPAAGERAGDVRIADRVEPQLDQVGVGDRVAPAAQFGRRRRGDGHAEQRCRHAPTKKKPLQPSG